MTSLDAYKIFQSKLNKLDTGDSIDISQGEFVLIYNEVQNKWFEDKYREISKRYIDDVQILIEPNINLGKPVIKDGYSEFNLPNNYFDYIRSYSKASRGNCRNRILYNEEVKIVNLSNYLKDSFYSPSFDYEYTLVTLSKDKLQVYTTDFVIDSVFFTYYRYPKQIDLEGYTKNGIPSTNINPELSDRLVTQVIDRCVIETQRRYMDIEGFQLSQTRENNNK